MRVNINTTNGSATRVSPQDTQSESNVYMYKIMSRWINKVGDLHTYILLSRTGVTYN